jgi:hypothetical protein
LLKALYPKYRYVSLENPDDCLLFLETLANV